ncbi:hypothetical protein C8R45DRAFT_924296 [Mycena sanguinolenta]|nr:hypothetical protein C8R45DRAFT_924296 [Mycena sanguinolenta]
MVHSGPNEIPPTVTARSKSNVLIVRLRLTWASGQGGDIYPQESRDTALYSFRRMVNDLGGVPYREGHTAEQLVSVITRDNFVDNSDRYHLGYGIAYLSFHDLTMMELIVFWEQAGAHGLLHLREGYPTSVEIDIKNAEEEWNQKVKYWNDTIVPKFHFPDNLEFPLSLIVAPPVRLRHFVDTAI